LAPLTQIDKPQANIINKKEKEKKTGGSITWTQKRNVKNKKALKQTFFSWSRKCERAYALMNTKEIVVLIQTSVIERCKSFTCLVVNVLWCIYTHKLKLSHPHDTSAYASPENHIINNIIITSI
jgi:hypothetical protein